MSQAPILFVGPRILTREDSAAVSDAVVRCLRTLKPSRVLRADRDAGVDAVVNLCASLLGVPQSVYSATGRIYGEKRLMWRYTLKCIESTTLLDAEDRDEALAQHIALQGGRVVRFTGFATQDNGRIFQLAVKYGASFSVETLQKPGIARELLFFSENF